MGRDVNRLFHPLPQPRHCPTRIRQRFRPETNSTGDRGGFRRRTMENEIDPNEAQRRGKLVRVSVFEDWTRWHGDTVTARTLHLPWSMPPSCFRDDFYTRLNGDRAILVYNRFKRENRRRYVCARPSDRNTTVLYTRRIANGIYCENYDIAFVNNFRGTYYAICVCFSFTFFVLSWEATMDTAQNVLLQMWSAATATIAYNSLGFSSDATERFLKLRQWLIRRVSHRHCDRFISTRTIRMRTRVVSQRVSTTDQWPQTFKKALWQNENTTVPSKRCQFVQKNGFW